VVVEGSMKVDGSFHDCRTEVFIGSCDHEDFVFLNGLDLTYGSPTKVVSLFGAEATASVEVGGEALKTVDCRLDFGWGWIRLPLFVADVELWIVSGVFTFGDGISGSDVAPEAGEVYRVFNLSVKREAVAQTES
jgi:hypothetical protein